MEDSLSPTPRPPLLCPNSPFRGLCSWRGAKELGQEAGAEDRGDRPQSSEQEWSRAQVLEEDRSGFKFSSPMYHDPEQTESSSIK